MKRFYLLLSLLGFLFSSSLAVAQDAAMLDALRQKFGQTQSTPALGLPTSKNIKKILPDAPVGEQPVTSDTPIDDDKPAEKLSRVEEIFQKFGAGEVSNDKNDQEDKKGVDQNKEGQKNIVPPLVPLTQFGYDFFQKPISPVVSDTSVSGDYVLGAGDEVTLTLWGLVEGIYNLKVNKEGNITLPKAGVIPVAGVQFKDLENVLRQNLEKYYKDFNLSVAINTLKTIPVYVAGEVEKPGRYNVSSMATLLDVLTVVKGPTKQGSLRQIQIKRNGESIPVDLYSFFISGNKAQDIHLEAGDSIFVPPLNSVVAIDGNVERPAIYEVLDGEKLGDLVRFAGGVLPVGSGDHIQIQRIEDHQKRVMVDVSLKAKQLKSTDRLTYALANMDVVKILPIYDEIQNKITVTGTVQHPGDYELKKGMRLSDVLNKDQLTPTTYLDRVEIVRTNPDTLERQILQANLGKLLKGDQGENILLTARDVIYVFTEERGEYKVTLKGEVKRPGEYIVKRGEKLSSVLERAGGFTEQAYPQGIIFVRQHVLEQQKKGLEKSLQDFQTALARNEVSSGSGFSAETATIQSAQSQNLKDLGEQLKNIKPEGRVIIEMDSDLEKFKKSPDNVNLSDQDYIEIPRRPDTVIVLGAVVNPTAVAWREGMTVKEYLKDVGGITKNASKKEVSIFKMNGRVLSKKYYAVNSQKLEPGDIVNVPDKIRRPGQALFTIKDIAQIIFNLGATTALLIVAL